jgi:glyoxylase-like metal-dependent hydrolase (beta-lactamase superfamily II)
MSLPSGSGTLRTRPVRSHPTGAGCAAASVATVATETRRVGSVEVTAILDADFPGGPLAESFPDAPADGLTEATSRYPTVATDDGHWRLRVRAWLVRHPGGLILMDTGLGGAGAPAHAWAPVTGAVRASLDQLGVSPRDVDTVVLSHVHDDHMGGVLADDAPAYPNARHLLQRADLDWLRANAGQSEDDAAILAELQPLLDADILDTLDGDTDVAPHLELHHLPGHTPGHQVLRVTGDSERLLLSADTWNHPAQLAHPDWPSGPDADHAQAAAARRSMLADLLSYPGTIVAPTHFAEAFGQVRSGRGGLAEWHPVT